MLDRILRLFEDTETDSQRREHDIRLAAAALLVEVARADHDHLEEEASAIAELLVETLELENAEVQALLERAGSAVENATSLYEFTRLINDHYAPDDKRELVASMWRVAYADGDLDKYEEHIIRRVAELIYLPHADFIRSKHDAAGLRDA
ncbi:MAG: TerB family tellurite resistance protein [Halieaceae bacterium]|jgi:uncharacterized tellurite resistance protein B-like protein|nr:TerB family tellurite resistance protein [Halieaceae bacterium]